MPIPSRPRFDWSLEFVIRIDPVATLAEIRRLQNLVDSEMAISRQLRKNWTMNPWRVEIEWWIDPISIARKIAAACPTCAKASTFP
jgi:hypothetical protein